ncbi:VCBS repeat-containing protein [Pollutibacter soli]|uniref:FG-GAP repeat domain-containing protein n=1 Tax=Pollutibacter soli TaxID=3034157 RepID=UPI003013845C
MKLKLMSILILSCTLNNINAQAVKGSKSNFEKITLSNEFLSEGVATGDLNKDGKTDVIAGYYWFEAPNWTRHELYPSRVFNPRKEYSNSFLNLGMDVNNDGWTDVVLIDFPGLKSYWLENPKNKPGHWVRHVIADSMGISNESPGFVDIDGDGRMDILCGDPAKRQVVWLKAPGKGQTNWKRYPISDTAAPATNRFSHGIGYGDINMDGKKDIVIKEGWWEGPKDPKQPGWVFHKANLGEDCSHMLILDVDNDGLNDVVSASAHRLGIWWFKQTRDASGNIDFARTTASETVSQTHSNILADFNRDGQPDFVVGKRWLAHHDSNDPGTNDPAYLIWFESTPTKAPYWIEHEIDNDSGAGLNIAVDDVNKDKKPDIIIANKKGVFVFLNRQ